MKNMIRITAIAVLAALYGLSSCNYLSIEDYFDDEFRFDSIFNNKTNAKGYLWGTAGRFMDDAQIFTSAYTPGPYATDEAFTQANLNEYVGQAFVAGDVSATNGRSLHSTWTNMYRIIRQCNIFFARVDQVPDWTAQERYQMLSYNRFFRALAYYYLLINFGPPILVGDDVMNNNEPLSYYDNQRCLYHEAVEYICTELEEASNGLPVKGTIIDFGLPTKGAAYGLIARIRLMHASPAFNGNQNRLYQNGATAASYFGRWTRSTDGEHYVTQGAEDVERWALAAAACKRIMEMENVAMTPHPVTGSTGYDLYAVRSTAATLPLPSGPESIDPAYREDYPNGANGIDHFHSVSDLFTGEAVGAINPEYVWGRPSDHIASWTQRSHPVSKGSWSECCLPQSIIDRFKMRDGRSIYDSSEECPYLEVGFTGSEQNISGYRLLSGTYNMYNNREMRFYADVGFSGRFWPMTSTTESNYRNATIKYHYDSPDGKAAAHNSDIYTATGYVITKFVHEIDAFGGANARRMQKAWGVIRYAEILLSYAEALNWLDRSYTVRLGDKPYTVERNIEEMRAAFNRVRYRAGLPGLTEAELASPREMQVQIEQERLIEFLHENRRYFDVRRWGVYEERDKEPLMGMNVDAPESNFFERVQVNSIRATTRVVDKKLLFVPLDKNEVRSMTRVDQNPGWED
jgi:hypothetical protein